MLITNMISGRKHEEKRFKFVKTKFEI